MILSTSDRIYATVAYGDVFDYPVTEAEIVRFFIGPEKSAKKIRATLRRMRVYYRKKSEGPRLYHLSGRKHIVSYRRIRNVWADAKWKEARRVAAILGHIPSVRLVGVTGGLARNNAAHTDDIDIFIISREKNAIQYPVSGNTDNRARFQKASSVGVGTRQQHLFKYVYVRG